MDELGYVPDKLGEWSERKIRIVAKYASAYSKILTNQRLRPHYIDGFTGGGMALSRETGEAVETTAKRILAIEPPFASYHLVDFDPAKAQAMRLACAGRPQATAYCDDANQILPKIFAKIRYEDYQRALCFLDPYKILLSWGVLEAAGANRALEAFIHFPTGDVQRNALRKDRDKALPADVERMNAMWGDETWREIGYSEVQTLFGPESQKQNVDVLLDAFASRLKAAGFTHVSRGLPMRNSVGVTLYHLFFATHNATAIRIANDILKAESAPKVGRHGN